MAHLRFGNESVIEHVKADEGTNTSTPEPRPDLGNRVTSMNLNEVDGDDNPSRAMNLQMAVRLWTMHSNTAPAWVESDDDDLLAQLVADHFNTKVGRPKSWTEDH
jgi:hypothetical protein